MITRLGSVSDEGISIPYLYQWSELSGEMKHCFIRRCVNIDRSERMRSVNDEEESEDLIMSGTYTYIDMPRSDSDQERSEVTRVTEAKRVRRTK